MFFGLFFLCFFMIKSKEADAFRFYQPLPPIKTWAVYYANEAKAADFSAYNLLVLEPHANLSVNQLAQNDKTILGYLSCGEVNSGRFYFEAMKKQKILLEENPNWPGAFLIDIRDKRWTKRVIEELIPDILHKGFHGVFLDTLDSSIDLENKNPKKYKGMKQAAVKLIQAMRYHFPYLKIMLNRAYAIAPLVGKNIDMLLAESVRTDYDFKTKKYHWVLEQHYLEHVQILKNIQKQNPRVAIFTLDYWDPKDSQKVKEIYILERQNGFLPYVTTIGLNTITPEPKP